MPPPLVGPKFGSYSPDEVGWLLTDLSTAELEVETALRELEIQSGRAHYAESLPIEYQPNSSYRTLFADVLTETAPRLATAVGVVTELVIAERGHDIVLVSLARAGTPIGILMRRWAARHHQLQLPHYAISIVRDRGIDATALQYLSDHHDPAKVVFVDGWTGKGAITQELTSALAAHANETGVQFNPDLAVLADPGHCVKTFGTRDDFLIASACLNSTVSGLISRTVLNRNLLGPNDFHGAKFYQDLAAHDQSGSFLDTITFYFDDVSDAAARQSAVLTRTDRTPSWSGMASVERLRHDYQIATTNYVKPGIGETTRVLLRRVPWRIIVREIDDPEHRHIRLLAADRGVPVVCDPSLTYACVGLIKDVTE
ncbi:cysteine protease StiP family protein [Mycobacterium frederiksbergense]|uniref:cysteine protease StiP family protein n=1 Tax=Mycolicibacterium frederiksbergense TaxID=117567 RepID=UPI0021F37897|nr:cysteine protease StiP family protein [Mycolicibacterium frederiksbergense]MCV7045994.1 cysteine protease StiP family protein [Mycolicibacterium frederiksbergense]